MFRHQFRCKLKTLLEAQLLMEGHATGGACTVSATREWNSVDRVDRFLTRIVLGRPFVKRFALGHAIGPLFVLSARLVCDVGVLWPNGWMDQDATWYEGRPRPWPHC